MSLSTQVKRKAALAVAERLLERWPTQQSIERAAGVRPGFISYLLRGAGCSARNLDKLQALPLEPPR